MQAVTIVAVCIACAVAYGILHDQVTARVCVEYFTIGHPPVFPTQSPTLLGIGWGVIATWWVGLMLGVPLAFAARAGRRPKRDVRSLAKPIATLLLVMGICAGVMGLVGFHPGPKRCRLPRGTHGLADTARPLGSIPGRPLGALRELFRGVCRRNGGHRSGLEVSRTPE